MIIATIDGLEKDDDSWGSCNWKQRALEVRENSRGQDDSFTALSTQSHSLHNAIYNIFFRLTAMKWNDGTVMMSYTQLAHSDL